MNATEPFAADIAGFEPSTALIIPEEPSLPAATGPQIPPAPPTSLSTAEKASIVLIALGPNPASKLLRSLGAGRVRRFAGIVNGMNEIEPGVVENVISEFLAQLSQTGALSGGREELKRFLSEVVDKEQLNQILEDVDNAGRSVWSILADVDDGRIATWLQAEHPQVAAIALSKLTSVKAARVLEKYDPLEARSIVLRMEHAASADDTIIAQIAKVIEEEFLPAVAHTERTQDPADLIAAVMNHVSDKIRAELMAHLTEKAPGLATSVQQVMFTFDNIVERVNPRDAALIARQIDETALLTALKLGGTNGEEVTEFFFNNMTKRLSERLREDLGAMEEPTRKDGEAARADLVAVIVGLRDNGDIKMVENELLEE
ncbi:MAG: FliG C-terminal domain-containing protein [Pseudomonadota bacterium]